MGAEYRVKYILRILTFVLGLMLAEGGLLIDRPEYVMVGFGHVFIAIFALSPAKP